MAAEVVEESPVPIITPTEVGNAFARQYYMILEQYPALVYRFYQDVSKLSRPKDGDGDGNGDGAMGSTTTMEAINEKIQSYGSLKADVKFVDAQESYNGGVIVLVTGSMISADDSRRDFTQTFFLAPQEKGYFVLNDIFRYLEGDFHHIEQHDDGMAPTTPSQEASLVQESHISEQWNGEVSNPFEDGEIPLDKDEEEPVAEVVNETPNESQGVIESIDKVEEMPKKSYASIVMKDTPGAAFSPNIQESVRKVQDQQVRIAPAPSSVAVAPSSSSDMVDDENNQEHKGDGHSIYLKNLPVNVSYELVEEEFKRFGPVKSGGIQILINRGFCYGFVEFEVAGAAQSAIQASPIIIGRREVVVEEKKSTYRVSFPRNNRGRFPMGRGGGFRGEGSRGRGGYGGGRGYGRGESNNNDFGNRGNNRGYQNRSEGYAGGRVQRGGGSGVGAGRAQMAYAQG